jgi:hypothetical protein
MRKLGACLFAAAAVTLIGTAALAAAHAHRGRRHHVIIIRHLIDHARGRLASSHCPPGSSVASYCTPPVVDTVYETFSSSTTTSIQVNANKELLVAFVQSDGPARGSQSSTVSGGGLTWTKVASENKALGDAEVWFAISPTKITHQTIKATASIPGYDENMTVVTFENAAGIGASGTFYSTKGAPTGTITTTQPNSWVWASGNDWGGDAARKAPPGQNIWVQALDLTVKKAFWVQSTTNPTLSVGTSVTINDTAPTGDPFNLVLVEIL